MKDPETKSNEPENPSRRKFLISLITVMGGLISLVLGGSSLLYFLSPAWRTKKEDWVDLGPVSGIKEGEPVKVDYIQRREDGWTVIENPDEVWVLKEKGDFVVYAPQCTHLGCHYHWDSSKQSFLCPCHGGIFSKDGKVVSGPPPLPLQRYPVKVENGSLFILPGEKQA